MIYWVDTTTTATSRDRIDSSVSTIVKAAPATPPSEAKSHVPRLRRRRDTVIRTIALASMFLLVTGYFGYRVLTEYQHFTPFLHLSKDLRVLPIASSHFAEYGVQPGDSVQAINGKRVTTRAEYRSALDNGGLRPVTLDFWTVSGGVHTVIWMQEPVPPKLDVRSDGTIASSAPAVIEEIARENSIRVSAINGVPLNEVENAARSAQEYENLTIDIAVVSGANPSIDFISVGISPVNLRLAQLFIGIAFFLLGAVACWFQPRSRSAYGFYVFCLVVGIFWCVRAVPVWGRFEHENWLYIVFECLLPGAVVLFIATFTPLRHLVNQAPSRRFRWMVGLCGLGVAAFGAIVGQSRVTPYSIPERLLFFALLAAVPLAFALWPSVGKRSERNWFLRNMAFPFSFSALLGTSAEILRSPTAYPGTLPNPLFYGWLGTLALLIFAAQFATRFVVREGVRPTPGDIVRGKTIRVASMAAFLPSLIYTVFMYRGYQAEWLRLLTDVTVVSFPLMITYAILRSDFLQVGELWREALVVGSAGVVFALTYALGIAVALPRLVSAYPETTQLGSAVLAGGLALFLLPFYQFLQRHVTRVMSRVPRSLEHLLGAVDADAHASHSLQDFIDRISGLLNASFEVSEPHWILVNADGHSHERQQSVQRVRGVEPLLRVDFSGRPFLTRDELLDRLGTTLSAREALSAMELCEADIAVPLEANGQRVGALAFGTPANGAGYSEAEIRTLSNVLHRVALHLPGFSRPATIGGERRIIDNFPGHPDAIGPYPISRVLGEGGMSYVYLGSKGAGQYAIKVPNHRVQGDPQLLARFLRESSALLQINHANIVDIVEIGRVGTEPYIVLPYFEAGTVAGLLRAQSHIDEAEALSLLIQATRALDAAAKLQILHRDVKPHNMFLTSDRMLKLGDFGLAELPEESTITQTGDVLGTRAYLAPEVLEGQRPTALSDQYSLGLTGFELLTGNRPFHGQSLEKRLMLQFTQGAPDPRRYNAAISDATATAIQRMLSKNPIDRFATYSLLLDALENCRMQLEPR